MPSDDSRPWLDIQTAYPSLFPLVLKVGGYLAFIGMFCLSAGLALASGKNIQGLETWGVLLNAR